MISSNYTNLSSCATNQLFEPHPKTKPSKQKILLPVKQVRFCEFSTGVILRPKTASDLHEAWYSKQEMEQFRKSVPKAAKRLLDSNPYAAKAYMQQTLVKLEHLHEAFYGVEYICGIEHILSAKMYQVLNISRINTRRGVMEEQSRQRALGINHVEELAIVARKASEFPKLWHQRIAVMNASGGYVV